MQGSFEDQISAEDEQCLIGDREPETLGLKSVGIVNLRGKQRPVKVLTLIADADRYTTAETGEIVRDPRAEEPAAINELG